MESTTLPFQVKSILSSKDQLAVMELWNQEYPTKLVYGDLAKFELYLKGLENPVHILLKIKNKTLGWAVKFNRDKARWFVIILSSAIHGKGIGSEIMNKLKTNETELNGWLVDHNSDTKKTAILIFHHLNSM